MKRTALTGLFLTAALLASPVFAADLCTTNLNTIKNQLASPGNMGNDQKTQLMETQKAARAAHKANNEKKCIELTTKALEDTSKGGGTEGGGGTDGGAK
ncbi:MAG: hypothetical protein JWQ69_3292 [Pseudomonas sp.]|nr:hypothetical protein [Pseudomonas sp.]